MRRFRGVLKGHGWGFKLLWGVLSCSGPPCGVPRSANCAINKSRTPRAPKMTRVCPRCGEPFAWLEQRCHGGAAYLCAVYEHAENGARRPSTATWSRGHLGHTDYEGAGRRYGHQVDHFRLIHGQNMSISPVGVRYRGLRSQRLNGRGSNQIRVQKYL